MTQGHRSPAGIVDDPLVELLDNTLTEVRGEHFDGELAEDMLAAIDPAKADAMRAGLLWLRAEALGWPINRAALIRVPYQREPLWQVVASRDRASISGEGPTLLAALTDLLAKLEARP